MTTDFPVKKKITVVVMPTNSYKLSELENLKETYSSTQQVEVV